MMWKFSRIQWFPLPSFNKPLTLTTKPSLQNQSKKSTMGKPIPPLDAQVYFEPPNSYPQLEWAYWECRRSFSYKYSKRNISLLTKVKQPTLLGAHKITSIKKKWYFRSSTFLSWKSIHVLRTQKYLIICLEMSVWVQMTMTQHRIIRARWGGHVSIHLLDIKCKRYYVSC